MGKYNLSSLKQKITPREKNEIEKNAANRFIKADKMLGTNAPENEVVLEPHKPMTRVVRKTFSIPESELNLINKIKDTALNKRVVLAESEVIRLGLLVAAELTEDDLEMAANYLEKMPMGRPPKKQS